ncbi:MAG TPA: tetratricopeptide repeat protein, partial [Candidatus Obscuribacterales bacterium]
QGALAALPPLMPPPPPPPPPRPAAPRFTDDTSVAVQPPEMPPPPPPRQTPPPLPAQEAGTPQQAAASAAQPTPPPSFSMGTPHNQTTSGRWKRVDLDGIPTPDGAAAQPPTQPPKPSQQLRGLGLAFGQPPTVQPPPAQLGGTGQTQDNAKPKIDPLMDLRTSKRMQMMSTAEDAGYVAPVKEAKGISKDVIIGGAIGVGLLLLLASQSFQALAFKNHFEEGVAALKANKNDVAVVEFSSSITANPNDTKALFFRALAEARMNNYKNALEDYNKVIALEPNNLNALVSRATLYNRTKSHDSAIMDCEKALHIDPNFLDAYRVRAVAYNQTGRYSEALADAKQFLDSYKNSSQKTSNKEVAEVAANRAYANFNKKEYDAAIADYTEAINADPENGQLYASRAVVYKQVHDWKKAMDDTNKAISLSPGDTSLFKIRGVCYAGLGEAQKAADDLNNLVKYNPSVENHRMRGQARLEVHDYKGAMEDFDFVLGATPHDQEARAKYQAARLGLQGTAKPDSMVADATPMKHEPINLKQPEPALVKRGYELMLAGNSDDAAQYLVEAVKRSPNDASARRYLAYTLIEAGESGEAVDQFAALTKMQSLPPGDMLMYAKALNDAKQPEQAVNVYRAILAADQTNDRARTQLINLYTATGDKEKAIRLAQEGIQASPNMKDSYQELIKKIQDKDKK